MKDRLSTYVKNEMRCPLFLFSKEKIHFNVESPEFWDDHWKKWLGRKDELLNDRKLTAYYLIDNMGLDRNSHKCLDIGGGCDGVSFWAAKNNNANKINVADIFPLNGAESPKGDNIKFIYQDAKQPFCRQIVKESPYDRIWICELEYLLSDNEWKILLGRCDKMLVDGGMLAITTSAVLNFPNFLICLAKAAISKMTKTFYVYKNGIQRTLKLHKHIISKACLSRGYYMVNEGVIKKRSRKYGINFGMSDCDIYGFVLKKKTSC